MNYQGILIGLSAFLIIGLFHPVVIKAEYYWGTGCWPLFLITGLLFCGLSLLAGQVIVAALLGVFAFSSFWSILELFEQKKRVEKGWFPHNPKRRG